MCKEVSRAEKREMKKLRERNWNGDTESKTETHGGDEGKGSKVTAFSIWLTCSSHVMQPWN